MPCWTCRNKDGYFKMLKRWGVFKGWNFWTFISLLVMLISFLFFFFFFLFFFFFSFFSSGEFFTFSFTFLGTDKPHKILSAQCQHTCGYCDRMSDYNARQVVKSCLWLYRVYYYQKTVAYFVCLKAQNGLNLANLQTKCFELERCSMI